MCTVGDNDYEEPVQCMEEKNSYLLAGALCKKCQNNKAEVVLRIKDTYCRQCFIEQFTHKFRATLGKSKILKPNDKVLIAVSGSPSSVALLHLVKEGIEIKSPKRLQCVPYVVYIDEGAALRHTYEQRKIVCSAVVNIIKNLGFSAYISSLACCLNVNNMHSKVCIPLGDETQLDIIEEDNVQLMDLFGQLKSLSSKEDMLLKLRQKLLFAIAEELKCFKIFLGDCATDLAVGIMANLSLGRGAQLPYDVGFCDSRHANIKVLRPMRDFLKKEIAFYNVFKNIESFRYPGLSTKVDPFSSIQKLTEKFIVELQNLFPSTVSTIFRTGDKLTCEGAGNSEIKTCILCEALLDTSDQRSSSLQATEFSQLISSPRFSEACTTFASDGNSDEQHSNSVCTSEKRECSTGMCTCMSQTESQKLFYDEIKEWLCYGCRLIVKEMDSLDAFPHNIINFVKTEINQKQLRKEIQDFLL